MIAVITGDMIALRKLVNQEIWLVPLKNLLAAESVFRFGDLKES